MPQHTKTKAGTMDRETFKKQQPFAGERKPSMHRRCIDHDYQRRCIYLITLVTENRRQLFGKLEGRSDAEKGSQDEPHIVLSKLGEAVQHNFYSIEERHPQIHVLALQMMPDHLHGILFVKDRIDKHLGQAIAGFKAGCNKDYRRIILGEPVPYVVALPQHTERSRPPRSSYDREHGLLFASGYNDRILLRGGQLDHWLDYLADNPRRLLAKREHPDLFRVQFGLHISGQNYAAIGNRFLLNHPLKRQVQCSRRLNEQEINEVVAHYMEEARNDAVLVSPSISPGEKAVMRAALDAHLPLIFLSPMSFTPFTKPGGEFIEACSQGNLLILAPWENRSTTQTLTRQECLALNQMTRAICEMSVSSR